MPSRTLSVLWVRAAGSLAGSPDGEAMDLGKDTFDVLCFADLGAAQVAMAGRIVDLVVLDEAPDAELVDAAVRGVPGAAIVVLCREPPDRAATIELLAAGAQEVLARVPVAAAGGGLAARLENAAARARATRRLHERIERYAISVRGAKDGLWDWKLGDDRIHYSDRWKTMLGFDAEALDDSADAWFGRIHEADVDDVTRALADHVNGLTETFEAEYRMRHRDDTWRWVLTRGLAVRDVDGRAYRIAGSQTDITKRKRVEQRLLHHAYHDGETGLPNRALLMDRLSRAMVRLQQGGKAFTLIAIELDNYRSVNDSFGHAMAESWTRDVARTLDGFRGPVDTLARVSRDQFFLLLENAGDLAASLKATDEIQATLQRPVQVDGEDLFSTASIGIVTGDAARIRPEDYLRDAGVAMNRAKALGGGHHRVFDAPMHRHVVDRLKLEKELRQGIERNEFWMQYQPIVAARGGEVAGFEALLRWTHPDRGLLGPADFIEVAEVSGLLTPIFERCFPTVLAQLSTWQKAFARAIFVNVNLSRGQFTEPGLMRIIDAALAAHPVEPYTLGFEMTESTMADDALLVGRLEELKQRKIRLLIDDFGTGYSSLSTLKQFPIDSLKIDKSFLAGLGTVKDNAEIVRAIVTLAHSMALDVTAEGVETEAQLRFITNIGCEYVQGYYFSKPMPPEVAGAAIREGFRVFTTPSSGPAGQAVHSRGKVLIVEHDQVKRNRLRLELQDEGFESLTAASGPQAIEVASAEGPEAVLLALDLPGGMDGLETCRKLKHSAETATTPVVFLIDRGEDDPLAIEALKAGGNDCLGADTPREVLCARLDSQVAIARAHSKLRRLAMTDELTGVFSRRFLFQALRRAIKAGHRRDATGLGAVLVDVDHFKQVNDTHGHIAGDRELKLIAHTIDAATRETDLVARFGGEEFVVMLQDTSLEGARTVAEKIRTAVREGCKATVSIGIAYFDHRELDLAVGHEDIDPLITTLLREADRALAEAKARGRDQLVVATSSVAETG
jgi:diguanylate cyclase (GGDEF)-like protein/PAS domain S-box-containing protein